MHCAVCLKSKDWKNAQYFKRWAQIDAESTHFYKTRFVLQKRLGLVDTAQTVSLGQWTPGLVDVLIFLLFIFSSHLLGPILILKNKCWGIKYGIMITLFDIIVAVLNTDFTQICMSLIVV